MNPTNAYGYDDISLVANYFDGDSRSELDTSVQFGSNKFKLPVVPANMKCCIDFELAEQLSESGYFYVLHRFYPYGEIKKWIEYADKNHLKTISISVGVKQEDKDLIEYISNNSLRVDYVTIDIAHGHCKKMKDMLNFIREMLNPQVFVIAGNVMTKDAVKDLVSWGANAIKVGIGPGKVCTTKLQTGFHSPMFTTIQQCSSGDFQTKSVEDICEEVMKEVKGAKIELTYDPLTYEKVFKCNVDWLKCVDGGVYSMFNKHLNDHIKYSDQVYISIQSIRDEEERRIKKAQELPPIIADGGIRNIGDVAKAINAGADMVMIGSMFTACTDSPAEDVYQDYGPHSDKMMPRRKEDWKVIAKKYYGSASYHNGNTKNIEGTLVEIPCNGMTYKQFLQQVRENLQSSISYSGGKELKDIKNASYMVHS